MNAVVQKPIQSLRSFMRHSFGGGIAALPPISFFAVSAICIIVFSNPLAAQQADDTNKQSTPETRLDLLFNKIMQTMPDEVREKVDSAGTSSHTGEQHASSSVRHEAAVSTEPATVEESDRRMQARLQELPDDLKAQVERTITEMQQRKEERKAQFRESRKNRP